MIKLSNSAHKAKSVTAKLKSSQCDASRMLLPTISGNVNFLLSPRFFASFAFCISLSLWEKTLLFSAISVCSAICESNFITQLIISFLATWHTSFFVASHNCDKLKIQCWKDFSKDDSNITTSLHLNFLLLACLLKRNNFRKTTNKLLCNKISFQQISIFVEIKKLSV